MRVNTRDDQKYPTLSSSFFNPPAAVAGFLVVTMFLDLLDDPFFVHLLLQTTERAINRFICFQNYLRHKKYTPFLKVSLSALILIIVSKINAGL